MEIFRRSPEKLLQKEKAHELGIFLQELQTEIETDEMRRSMKGAVPFASPPNSPSAKELELLRLKKQEIELLKEIQRKLHSGLKSPWTLTINIAGEIPSEEAKRELRRFQARLDSLLAGTGIFTYHPGIDPACMSFRAEYSGIKKEELKNPESERTDKISREMLRIEKYLAELDLKLQRFITQQKVRWQLFPIEDPNNMSIFNPNDSQSVISAMAIKKAEREMRVFAILLDNLRNYRRSAGSVLPILRHINSNEDDTEAVTKLRIDQEIMRQYLAQWCGLLVRERPVLHEKEEVGFECVLTDHELLPAESFGIDSSIR